MYKYNCSLLMTETLSTMVQNSWKCGQVHYISLDKQFFMSPFVQLLCKPPIMLPNMKYISRDITFSSPSPVSAEIYGEKLLHQDFNWPCMYKLLNFMPISTRPISINYHFSFLKSLTLRMLVCHQEWLSHQASSLQNQQLKCSHAWVKYNIKIWCKVSARPAPCPSPLIGSEEKDWSIPIRSSMINLVDKITT